MAMDLTVLSEPNYSSLTNDGRRQLLTAIAEKYGATIREFIRFERFGRHLDTAIFIVGGIEFVFVPGAEVRLGWDGFVTPPSMDMWVELAEWFTCEESPEEGDLEVRKQAQEEAFQQDTIDIFREQTTPKGTFTIGPMLVERCVIQPCWRDIRAEDVEVRADVQELIRKAIDHHVDVYTLRNRLEVSQSNNTAHWRAREWEELTFDQLKQQVEASGFSLPTMREWEYLAGGGCETLAVWGDSLDYNSFRSATPGFASDAEAWEYPNFFGLTIAFDPFKREIVTTDDGFMFKGGDGGCNCHGGAGFSWAVAFPTSPYFEETEMLRDGPSDRFDFYRRVIRIDG